MFKRTRRPEDFAEEIKAHLELEADELKGEGLSEEEARRKARVEFGNLQTAQERFSLRNRVVWLDDLLRDVKFALRQLWKAPSFAVTAMLTLALGIGANTAIFSLVNSLLLKPLPVPNPEQIATLVPRENNGPLLQTLSWNEYKQVRAQSGRSFSDVFADSPNLDGLAAQGQQPERIMTEYVSGNFFDGLGLKAAAGRLFLPSEGETLGQDAVIVLGYDYWKQKFDGDPNVVGRPVWLDGHPLTIIGVAPKGFPGMQLLLTTAAFLPLSELPTGGTPIDAINNWQTRMFLVNARLRPGVDLKQARTTLDMVSQQIRRLQPEVEKKLTIEAFPEPQLRINPGDPKTIFIIAGLFLSLAVLVLLLACVNVANLVLVRATAREREMAIRTALGARRSRLIAQMITESVTLAFIGGAMGVELGMGASRALGHHRPARRSSNKVFLRLRLAYLLLFLRDRFGGRNRSRHRARAAHCSYKRKHCFARGEPRCDHRPSLASRWSGWPADCRFAGVAGGRCPVCAQSGRSADNGPWFQAGPCDEFRS